MSDYSTFPITMVHPSYTAAKSEPIVGTQVYGANGQILRQDMRGTPERYPPVTAANETEEQYWEAQGYKRAGKIDPSAWAREHSSAPVETYVPEMYPVWRNGVLINSVEEDPEADPEAAARAKTEREEAEAIKGGKPTPNLASIEAEKLKAELADRDTEMDAMRKSMADMQEQMRQFMAMQSRPQTSEIEDSKPEEVVEPIKRRGGRPRKVA